MLVIILESVQLGVEGIALILAIDRLLDMFRTVVNVTGDAVVTTIVAGSEGQVETPAVAAGEPLIPVPFSQGEPRGEASP